MEFVALALIGLGVLFSLVAFVCSILIIVKMFQFNQTGLAIASVIGVIICGFGHILALIFGWQNKVAWGLQKVMPIYTASIVLAIVLGGAGYAGLIVKALNEIPKNTTTEFEFDYDSESPAFEP